MMILVLDELANLSWAIGKQRFSKFMAMAGVGMNTDWSYLDRSVAHWIVCYIALFVFGCVLLARTQATPPKDWP